MIGIDVGSEIHFARAFDWRHYEYTKKPFEFSNSEEGFSCFKAWTDKLEEKYGKVNIIPEMELTGHYGFDLANIFRITG